MGPANLNIIFDLFEVFHFDVDLLNLKIIITILK